MNQKANYTHYQRVFVTGALGFVGRAIMDRFRLLGAEVRGLELQPDLRLGIVAGDDYPGTGAEFYRQLQYKLQGPGCLSTGS